MKKSNRELNIFSMSTLDLFASAMGAFILITLVLFPYVLNTGDSEEQVTDEQVVQVKAQFEEQVAQLKAQFEERVAEAKAQLEKQEAQVKAQLEKQVEEPQPPVPSIDNSDERVEEVKALFEGQIEAMEDQVDALQYVIDSIPFYWVLRQTRRNLYSSWICLEV